jgi:Leucine-rich repeat (LRR) protein
MLIKQSKNVLESMQGLATLALLEELYACQNIVTTIEASTHDSDWNPENHPSLRYLDLSDNGITRFHYP